MKKLITYILITLTIATQTTFAQTNKIQENTQQEKITKTINKTPKTGFTITPINNKHNFNITIQPGETTEQYVIIKNLSDKKTTFLLYGADSTLSAQKTLAYKTRQAGITKEGTWIKFETPKITLKPKEQKIEKFTITIPKDTKTGDYKVGITMEKTMPNNTQSNLKIVARIVITTNIKVTNKTTTTKQTNNNQNWKSTYFIISLLLFIISFIALILVTIQEKKLKNKKKTNTKKTKTTKTKNNKTKQKSKKTK